MDIWNIIEFDSIDSTSKYIKENLDKLSVFDVITANRQTEGYGRLNRSWYDNNDNLSFSCLFEFPITERLGLITQMAAVSVVEALDAYGINAYIKWPNDIIVNDKKISGILVENVLTDKAHVVLGIGVNVNNKEFSDDIRFKATSMCVESNQEYNKSEVLQTILDRLEKHIESFIRNQDDYLEVVRSKSYLIGKHVELFEGEIVEVLDIDELGRLKVKQDGNILTYMGSEVSLTNIYKS